VSILKGEFRLRSGQISSEYFDKYPFEVFVSKGPNLGCAMHWPQPPAGYGSGNGCICIDAFDKKGGHKDDKILDG
jgi:hypothetical protein